ncbi:hypothetical protein Aduo_001734 [Ancylostoma duodenale]
MDLYEPIGDQKNVVDAPLPSRKAQQKQPAKDGPMMPPMKAPLLPPMKSRRGQADHAAPLRDGDEVDLESEAGEGVGSTGGMPKGKPKKSSMSTVDTSHATKRRLQSRICVLKIAAVIVIVLCSVFLVIIFVTVLHTARAVGFVKALAHSRCS